MLSNEQLQSIKQRFGIIGENAELEQAIRIAVQVADTDLPVLITGESGVGKENFPKIIHEYSARKHSKYVAVNCGAIPEGTIDSELFGHEKGSFTGALAERKGYFEVADGGTIFLDEVGELPLSTQARLLRVLQDGEFYRVGSSEVRKTNVRVVAATNVNMQQALSNGSFRSDLYYRLNAVPIHIPPLRMRAQDIFPLFTKFANDFAETYHRPALRLQPSARAMLESYYWRGNIRQLKNVADQISAVETNPEISVATLSRYLPDENASGVPVCSSHSEGQQTYSNELLYKFLFELKNDLNELKKSIAEIKSMYHQPTTVSTSDIVKADPALLNAQPTHNNNDDYEEAQVVDTPLAVGEMEKELIRKALEKHGGKRKCAALDLEISERTLYRKIKEYGLEG